MIQDNQHLVHVIAEKVDDEVVLISLNQATTFNIVYHHDWMQTFAFWRSEGKISYCTDRTIHQSYLHLFICSCAGSFPLQTKNKPNPAQIYVACGTILARYSVSVDDISNLVLDGCRGKN